LFLDHLIICQPPHCSPASLQIKAGRWHGPEGKSSHVTQYHDVIGDNLGSWARIVVQVSGGLFATCHSV
jgi:hypothetical protein